MNDGRKIVYSFPQDPWQGLDNKEVWLPVVNLRLPEAELDEAIDSNLLLNEMYGY